jgi:hypothetical protein
MRINKAAVFTVFNQADKMSASFASELLRLGIGDRAMARPLAMEWASKKYDAPIEEGQRGAKLPRDSAAEKAMNRVLQVCFPSADLAQPKAASHTDVAQQLAAKFAKLDKAEQRRFLKLIAK